MEQFVDWDLEDCDEDEISFSEPPIPEEREDDEDTEWVGNCLPPLPPVRDSKSRMRRYSRVRFVAFAVTVAAVALVAGSILCVRKPIRRRSEDNYSAESTNDEYDEPAIAPVPTEVPTKHPVAGLPSVDVTVPEVPADIPTHAGPKNQTSTSRFPEVQAYLVQQGVSTLDSLISLNTPQFLAALWIADQDSLRMPIPVDSAVDFVASDAYHFITRYVLALLYTATNSKNGWIMPARFASSKPVCEWLVENFMGETGVRCETKSAGTYCASARYVMQS